MHARMIGSVLSGTWQSGGITWINQGREGCHRRFILINTLLYNKSKQKKSNAYTVNQSKEKSNAQNEH